MRDQRNIELMNEGKFYELLSDNKFLILKAISLGTSNPTSIAEITNTSLSNVSQQIKILEAYGLIRKVESLKNSNKYKTNESSTQQIKTSGKPKTNYEINSNNMSFAVTSKELCVKKTISINKTIKPIISIIANTDEEDIAFLLKFYYKYEEVIAKIKAFGIVKSSKESIELFIITDHLDEIRGKFSNIFIDEGGRTKKIINWSHNETELREGLIRKDKYFIDFIKNIRIIEDKEGVLQKYLNWKE